MRTTQAPQLYRLTPRSVLAFQWLPETPEFSYPKWFEDMIVNGRAYVVLNDKDQYISLSNKRGDYRGLIGDWVVKDEYGHIYVVSSSTFYSRYEAHRKEPSPNMKGNTNGPLQTLEAETD